tara:strand:+ start:89 stop:487 length:399 start_codon:yes stop_codon:yes gene_type:complete
MITLKKIWAFLKTHWYIPVIIIVGIILKSQNNRMLKIIDVQKESYEKQKTAIENANIEKNIAKKKIDEEYNDAITAIETIYNLQNRNLKTQQKKEVKKIVKQYYNDKDSLSKEISKTFGLIYVPKKDSGNSG